MAIARRQYFGSTLNIRIFEQKKISLTEIRQQILKNLKFGLKRSFAHFNFKSENLLIAHTITKSRSRFLIISKAFANSKLSE